MHMVAPAAARGAHGAWRSSPSVLSSDQVFLSSPDVPAAATVRFTRRTGGKWNRAVLCLASGGGPPRDGEWEPTDSSWDGRLVDEGMATLRRRIREARAPASEPEEDEEEGEVSGDDGLPGEWTELERRHHGSYVAGVREAVRVLQAFLTCARPGLGAWVVALVLLSVPASVLLVSAQLIHAVHTISSAVLNGRM